MMLILTEQNNYWFSVNKRGLGMYFRRLREYAVFLKSLCKTTWRLLWGMWRLTKLPHPAITIFGGARVPFDSPYAIHAKEIAKTLAADGFSIITGGGPGIMEAANAGAIEYLKTCNIDDLNCVNKFVSAGIGLLHLNLEKANPYVQENIVMEHFFARKWLLVRYSVGFIVFPGGFGTLDELFEIVTLVQCNRMAKVPIILFDTDYWKPLSEWIETRALKNHMIEPIDTQIIFITDSVQAAVERIRRYCIECERSISYSGFDKK
jgi:uncharacterized protein (TIGR00730 family)